MARASRTEQAGFLIALPALLFTSANRAASRQVWRLLAVPLAATVLIALVALGVGIALRMPGRAVGTLMQSAFRRNLAYIGIPLLAYSFSESAPENNGKSPIASAVIVMILTMAVYNILAVIVLQAGSHSTKRADWKKLALSIATNPLLVAGLLGLIVPVLGLALPSFVQRALESLGAAAVPIALMCIGGSLATTPLRGRLWIVTAALLKVVVLPVLVFFLARLGPAELRVALVLSSCPTAAAAFVMARQMGGDESLASGSIALSTLLSSISLAMSLSLTAWK